MTFEDFTIKLAQQLTLPLPAESAFEKMSVPNRADWKPNEKTRKSAVLVLLYEHGGQIYTPLILRPKYDGVHAGQMAFPGGRQERQDENLARTALREAQEEVGIKASDVTILGELTEIFIAPSNFFVQPVVGFLNYRPTFYPDPREVDAIYEVKLSDLMDETIIGQTTINVRELSLDVPCYDIESRKIWGATALMIAEFNQVVVNMGG